MKVSQQIQLSPLDVIKSYSQPVLTLIISSLRHRMMAIHSIVSLFVAIKTRVVFLTFLVVQVILIVVLAVLELHRSLSVVILGNTDKISIYQDG